VSVIRHVYVEYLHAWISSYAVAMTRSGRQPKLVRRSRLQLQEGAPVHKHHVALYSITSDGKASVRRERLSGDLLATQRGLLRTALASEASQSAASQPGTSGVYDTDDFMDYVPSSSCEDAVDSEPGKRKRTAGVRVHFRC